MKAGWSNFVKDYLTFSKKERRGIAITVLARLLFYFIPRFVTINKALTDKQAFQAELAEIKISIDTAKTGYRYPDRRVEKREEYEEHRAVSTATLFPFDPNTLSQEGWRQLGVREKTIQTIQHFIAKGYQFRKAEDLRKIYGLHPDEADRLVPFVKITQSQTALSSNRYHADAAGTNVAEPRRFTSIDINLADTTAFISLPGIGSKLATRIINFRQKLGGFFSVNQIAETYGLPDSTFQVIRTRLHCNFGQVRKININTASADELKVHPYIRWNIANAIVNYRSQHGNFSSLTDLRNIEIINDELYNKIASYLDL